ncbi:hypothetical protein [Paenibacillus sp. GCM10027629]|uniref:hypothetical protein n=1 Tax=Paenibacillus sp. GCM10027629 TaxID=3273414 RepID=UPI0036D2DD90
MQGKLGRANKVDWWHDGGVLRGYFCDGQPPEAGDKLTNDFLDHKEAPGYRINSTYVHFTS